MTSDSIMDRISGVIMSLLTHGLTHENQVRVAAMIREVKSYSKKPRQDTVPISGLQASPTIAAYDRKLVINSGDCGIDLFPALEDGQLLSFVQLTYCQVVSVPTRVNLLVPEGCFAWIAPRSSSFDRLQGCTILPGIIDHGYTGEYKIRISVPYLLKDQNETGLSATFLSLIHDLSKRQVALAQAIIIPYRQAAFEMMDELPLTGRGARGWGSTDARPEHGTDLQDDMTRMGGEIP